MVSTKWFEKWMALAPKLFPLDFPAVGITGTEIRHLCMMYVPIRLGAAEIVNKVYVAENCLNEAILGNDILTAFKVQLGYADKRMNIGGQVKTVYGCYFTDPIRPVQAGTSHIGRRGLYAVPAGAPAPSGAAGLGPFGPHLVSGAQQTPDESVAQHEALAQDLEQMAEVDIQTAMDIAVGQSVVMDQSADQVALIHALLQKPPCTPGYTQLEQRVKQEVLGVGVAAALMSDGFLQRLPPPYFYLAESARNLAATSRVLRLPPPACHPTKSGRGDCRLGEFA